MKKRIYKYDLLVPLIIDIEESQFLYFSRKYMDLLQFCVMGCFENINI